MSSFRTALGILLLASFVAAGHLLPGLDNSEVENGIRDSLHIVVFAVFAVLVFELLVRHGKPTAIIATFLIITIVGGLSEFLQSWVGKQPDFYDIARDLSGAALAVLARVLWRRSSADAVSEAVRAIRRAISILLGIAIFLPLFFWLSVIGLNRSTFPTILSFDAWWETHLYGPVNAEVVAPVVAASGRSEAAAEVHLTRSGRSGLLVLPMVSNWTDYEYLVFAAVMTKGPNTTVTVRINDGDRIHHFSNRYMITITVTNEVTQFRLPLDEMISEPGLRPMDLSDIHEIVIFARDKRDGTVLLLEEIRLE